jgi:hypothetical protein
MPDQGRTDHYPTKTQETPCEQGVSLERMTRLATRDPHLGEAMKPVRAHRQGAFGLIAYAA